MEDLERAQTRLDNIRSVEPILSALRTIALGSWRAALKQKAGVQRYTERLRAMLPYLLPRLQLPGKRSGQPESLSASKRVLVLVVGSERGLCGHFNAVIAEWTERYLAQQTAGDAEIELELCALGSRLVRILQRQGHPLAWSGALSATAIPSSGIAFELTRRWLARYEARDLDAVDVLYNVYRGAGSYRPTSVRLIPPQMPGEADAPASEAWPPPIIETDPLSLYARIVEQWAAIDLYKILLESTAVEQSARYQLMEEATKNTGRLIEELTMAVQMARRHAITREMQELAAGAGLLG